MRIDRFHNSIEEEGFKFEFQTVFFFFKLNRRQKKIIKSPKRKKKTFLTKTRGEK